MLATALIVFREMLEAGLVVGVVLAATRGIRRRGLWAAMGVVAGVAGACVLAVFADRLASLAQGAGQELFSAAVLTLAVAMLTWHNVWMAKHGREIADEARRLGAAVAAGEKPLIVVAVLCGVALLREGAEVVLFLYGIAVSGGTSSASMIAGGAIGLIGGALVSAALYLGLAAIPIRRLFSVTSTLITFLAAGLGAQAVALLQQAGHLEVGTATVWDASHWLHEGGVLGRVLHALIGYMDRPSGAQLVAYIAVVVVIAGLTRTVRMRALHDATRATA